MSFLKYKLAWARQNPLFWINISLATMTIILLTQQVPVVNGSQSDLRFRLWGMALQLIGAWTVWKDLSATAKKFGKVGMLRRNLAWLQDGFMGHERTLNSEGNNSLNMSCSARASVRRKIDASKSIEERLEILERNFRYIDNDLENALKTIDEQNYELTAKIQEQNSQFNQAINKANMDINDGFSGNYGILLFGLCWLFFGIVFASIAPEIIKITNHQFENIILSL